MAGRQTAKTRGFNCGDYILRARHQLPFSAANCVKSIQLHVFFRQVDLLLSLKIHTITLNFHDEKVIDDTP